MKSKLLLLIPFIFSIILTKANEKEPNNDFQTANTLALNGKDSGKIKTTSDEDWWDVTINADGELDVTVTVRNHQLINVYIIEECNGGFCNHVIAWGYTDTSITLYAGNAGAGTYTIRLFGNGGTTPSYYLSNTAIPVTGANDEEINDDIYIQQYLSA